MRYIILLLIVIITNITLTIIPRRSAKMPVSFNKPLAQKLLLELKNNLELYPHIATLTPADFGLKLYQEEYDLIEKIYQTAGYIKLSEDFINTALQIEDIGLSLYKKNKLNEIMKREKSNLGYKLQVLSADTLLLEKEQEKVLFTFNENGTSREISNIKEVMPKIQALYKNALYNFAEDKNWISEKRLFIEIAEIFKIKSKEFDQNVSKNIENIYQFLISYIPHQGISTDETVKILGEKFDFLEEGDLSALSKFFNEYQISRYEKCVQDAVILIEDNMDRSIYNGRSIIAEVNNDLARKIRPLTLKEKILGNIFSLASILVTFSLVSDNSLGSLLTIFSIGLLTVFSLEWAYVDWDTMYLDMPAFYLGSLISWLVMILGLTLNHHVSQLKSGIFMTILMIILFEGVNLFYKKFRGRDGMGLGDTFIIVATIGLPTALVGKWQMGYRIAMLSFVTGIIGWLLGKALKEKSKKSDKDQPFAFGPYLALGWVVALVSWKLTGGLTSLGF